MSGKRARHNFVPRPSTVQDRVRSGYRIKEVNTSSPYRIKFNSFGVFHSNETTFSVSIPFCACHLPRRRGHCTFQLLKELIGCWLLGLRSRFRRLVFFFVLQLERAVNPSYRIPTGTKGTKILKNFLNNDIKRKNNRLRKIHA